MEYWIWLSQLKGVGPILQKRLLDKFDHPENIHHAKISELLEVDGIGESIARKIVEFRVGHVLGIFKKVERLRLEVITADSSPFADVFSCPRTPILFYYRGQLPSKRGLAIVGARRCTEEAKQVAEEMASTAARNGVGVISGMAKGVDSYAHTAALREGGYTMAVLANGVDVCYPKEHRTLYEKILVGGGAILSAFPPGVIPHPKFFLERNAHISAWSTNVVVVQAAENSGSLTTAKFAIEQGRKLFTVPHSIYLKEAKGSNKLLEQGAKPYLSPQSLGLGLCKQVENISAKVPLSPLEQEILDHLHKLGTTCPIATLTEVLKQPEMHLNETLMLMEMNNLIKIKGKTVSLSF